MTSSCQLATIASLGLQHVGARIALEQRDRHKNHFIAMLSHELRNPLTPIRNSLYILDRAVPGGEQAKRAHEVIGRQSAHLTRPPPLPPFRHTPAQAAFLGGHRGDPRFVRGERDGAGLEHRYTARTHLTVRPGEVDAWRRERDVWGADLRVG